MHNQILHRDRKDFCCYCLQSFSTPQILDRRVHDCFDINIKKMIKMAKTGETVKFKNYTRDNKIAAHDL